MKVAIDAVGIRGHGGAAILCELLHWLPILRPEWKWHVILFERDLREFDDPPLGNNVKIEHTRFGNSGWQRIKWIQWELKERIQEIGADALFAFANMGSNKPCIPQVLYVQQTNVFFTKGITGYTFIQRLRFWMIRQQILRGAKASRAVIVQTETMRQQILSFASDLRSCIHVIPSGYRTPSTVPILRPEKKSLIDRTTRPRLIYVSHPSEHKNHEALLCAMPMIVKEFPNANLLLTLEKKPPNSRYASFIKSIVQLIENLGLTRHVVMTGILGPDEVSYALGKSDMMVFPSLAESFGLGLVEAMAAGCPVAVSDLSYARDVARDAAVYFDPTNPEDISHVVILTLSDNKQIWQLKEKGLGLKDRYSYERISQQIAALFEHVFVEKNQDD